MGSCPFCRGDVAEDVLLNGGHCPHCLIEIPGEETPTDPGEQAKAMQQAEEAAAKGGGKGPLIAVAAVVLIGLGVGGWFATRADPADEVYMDDSEDFVFAPSTQHVDLPGEEQPEDAAETAGAGSTRTAKRDVSGGGSGGSVAKASPPPTGGSIAGNPEAAPPAQGGMVPSVASGPAESGASPPVAADPLGAFAMASGPASKGPQGIVLEKDGDIYEMVRSVLQVKGNQMKQCYEQRLKVKSDLRGTWNVSFDILESGRTASVKIKGQGVKDSALESCMKAKVEKWTFQRIARSTHIDKPFGFGR
jgi:hypothetical protein